MLKTNNTSTTNPKIIQPRLLRGAGDGVGGKMIGGGDIGGGGGGGANDEDSALSISRHYRKAPNAASGLQAGEH